MDRLEAFHGPQSADWPTDPYEFLVWWHCGYPASDTTCAKGWTALRAVTGIDPDALLDAPVGTLAAALKAGGMVPELRAMRLKEVATRVLDEYEGDLRRGLVGPPEQLRKRLKKFPNIADGGADRMMLFAGIAPVAAVPSNNPQVLSRLLKASRQENYTASYRASKEAIEAEVPATFEARTRAYLLLKRHGQEVCKRTTPRCEACPLRPDCRFAAG